MEMMERRWHGIDASEGIAIGPAYVLGAKVTVIERRVLHEQVTAELQRLDTAIRTTEGQLALLHAQLDERDDRVGMEIVQALRHMLGDPDFLSETQALIREHRFGAEWAVRQALDHVEGGFEAVEGTYFQERARDFEGMGQRLLRNLLELPELHPREGVPTGAVAVGGEVSPLDVFHLHGGGVAAFVTESGGKTSHAAIVARSLGLPYVAGAEGISARVRPGDLVALDGARGEVIVNPTEETLAVLRNRSRHLLVREHRLKGPRKLEARTIDGVTVRLGANVERLEEISEAIDLGADCVGLVRTELLYLDRPDLPGEDEQFHDAAEMVKALGGRAATFRTLDLGPGKLPAAVRVSPGTNPALGIRAVRLSLRRPDLLRTQLRALYRASAFGPLRIMFPLVASVTELCHLRAFSKEIRDELTREGVAHDTSVPLGTMVETPSAVAVADHFARHADFLSIGTNDLIQYAFAADRDNDDVAYLYHPLHPALLRMIRTVVQAAGAAGTPVSLCGDMAGEPAYTWILLGLGLRELSMAPRYLPAVKSVIRGTRLQDAEDLTARALDLETEVEVESLVLDTMHGRFPLELPPPPPGAATEG
jgi:phosphotransferase system enzyme I (PtsI)